MIKDKLIECKEMAKEIRDIKEKIETLYARIESPQSRKITDMPVYHSGVVTSEVEETIVKIDELKTMYEEKLQVLIDSQKEIENAIENLPSKERRIIRFRYIDGLSWNKICEKMGYSYRSVLRYHGNALKMLCK